MLAIKEAAGFFTSGLDVVAGTGGTDVGNRACSWERLLLKGEVDSCLFDDACRGKDP